MLVPHGVGQPSVLLIARLNSLAAWENTSQTSRWLTAHAMTPWLVTRSGRSSTTSEKNDGRFDDVRSW